jgi:peptidoglycan/LPS O-acetylase OafA/YrhL
MTLKTRIENNFYKEYLFFGRGLAIIFVLMAHASNQIISNITNFSFLTEFFYEFGGKGVQLFYVISSITLCLSSLKRNEKNYLYFYIRRFFRIVPMFYFAFLIYFIYQTYYLNQDININFILKDLFFVSAIFSNNPNETVQPGGYTISTEIIFYLAFPFLFNFIKKQNLISLKVMILFMFCFIIYYYSYVNINNLQGMKLLPHTLAQFIVFFIPAFFTVNNFFNKQKNINYIIFFLSFFLAMVSLFKITDLKILNFYGSFMFFLTLAFISFLNISKNFDYDKNLLLKIILAIGKQSFGIFLFHFILLDFIVPIISNFFTNINDIDLLIIFIFNIFFSFIISYILSIFIEKPGIRFGKTIINRMKARSFA